MPAATIYLETFGCQMNVLDSQLVRGQLQALGYRFIEDWQAADVVLYNTCSVREQAENKVYSRIGEVGIHKKANPGVVLGVIGCMAERDGLDMVRRHPQIDLLCGPGELDKVPLLIDNVVKTRLEQRGGKRAAQSALQGNTHRRSSTLAAAEDQLEMLDLSRSFSPDEHQGAAYVRITRGCNKFCTYCVVPRTRGAEVHRPPDNIVEECRRLVEAGVIEITLLGQTVNHYHFDHGAAVEINGIQQPQVGAVVGPRRVPLAARLPVPSTLEQQGSQGGSVALGRVPLAARLPVPSTLEQQGSQGGSAALGRVPLAARLPVPSTLEQQGSQGGSVALGRVPLAARLPVPSTLEQQGSQGGSVALGTGRQAASGTRTVTTFAGLMARIHDEVPDLQRLRFVTNFPRDFGDDILEVMARSPRICRYIHLPVQSGSDRMLQLMNRGYKIAQYRELLGRIRSRLPGVQLASDLICGFPTETEEDHQATCELLREAQFKNCFIFKYSPRPGTAAIDRFPDDVPEEVKRRRNNELLGIQAQVSTDVHQQCIGQTFRVFVESVSHKSQREHDAGGNSGGATVTLGWEKAVTQLTGRTDGDLIVCFEADPSLVGTIVEVKIDRAAPLALFGKLVGNVVTV